MRHVAGHGEGRIEGVVPRRVGAVQLRRDVLPRPRWLRRVDGCVDEVRAGRRTLAQEKETQVVGLAVHGRNRGSGECSDALVDAEG